MNVHSDKKYCFVGLSYKFLFELKRKWTNKGKTPCGSVGMSGWSKAGWFHVPSWAATSGWPFLVLKRVTQRDRERQWVGVEEPNGFYKQLNSSHLSVVVAMSPPNLLLVPEISLFIFPLGVMANSSPVQSQTRSCANRCISAVDMLRIASISSF